MNKAARKYSKKEEGGEDEKGNGDEKKEKDKDKDKQRTSGNREKTWSGSAFF